MLTSDPILVDQSVNCIFDQEVCFCFLLDDDQDVHYCGRCKLSFTDLSEYIKHKANRVCQNKSSLTDVVEKLPIDGNQSQSKSTGKSGDAADDTSTDTAQKTQEDTEANKESPSARRVEVQFLDQVEAAEEVPSLGEEHVGQKGSNSAKTGECSS